MRASPRLTNARISAELDTDFSVRMLVPSGTVAGSTWSVTIENDIDIVTEAQPLPL